MLRACRKATRFGACSAPEHRHLEHLFERGQIARHRHVDDDGEQDRTEQRPEQQRHQHAALAQRLEQLLAADRE